MGRPIRVKKWRDRGRLFCRKMRLLGVIPPQKWTRETFTFAGATFTLPVLLLLLQLALACFGAWLSWLGLLGLGPCVAAAASAVAVVAAAARSGMWPRVGCFAYPYRRAWATM